jgi:DNA-directed RNA polymerase specialized sigma subunit
MDEKLGKELLLELQAIKKLLIMQLLKSDSSQKEIATMLGVSEATMSRMMPRKGVDKKG